MSASFSTPPVAVQVGWGYGQTVFSVHADAQNKQLTFRKFLETSTDGYFMDRERIPLTKEDAINECVLNPECAKFTIHFLEAGFKIHFRPKPPEGDKKAMIEWIKAESEGSDSMLGIK